MSTLLVFQQIVQDVFLTLFSSFIVCHDPNGEFSFCEAHCKRTCDQEPQPCSKICQPGCVCKNGYIVDEYFKCNPCPPVYGESLEY